MAHEQLWYYVVLATLSVIQGPVAIILGAAASTTGIINPVGIFIAVTIGNTSADILWYLIGKLGKVDWLLRIKWLRLNSGLIGQLQSSLNDQAPKVITLAKLSSVFVLPVMIAAGLIRLSWKRWLPTLLVIEVFKNIILILAGYYSVVTISQFQKGATILIIGATILSIAIPWWFFRKSLHLDRHQDAPIDQNNGYQEN